jgi:hypothetical protein
MNGVTFIKIEGQEVQLRFGLPANRMIITALEEYAADMITKDEKLNETGIATVLFAGYYNACLVNEVKPIFTRGDFLRLMDEAYLRASVKKEIIDAINVYEESAYTKAYNAEVNNAIEEAKKKLTGKHLINSSSENLDLPVMNTSEQPLKNSSLKKENGSASKKK